MYNVKLSEIFRSCIGTKKANTKPYVVAANIIFFYNLHREFSNTTGKSAVKEWILSQMKNILKIK